jgi:hypothetical protein
MYLNPSHQCFYGHEDASIGDSKTRDNSDANYAPAPFKSAHPLPLEIGLRVYSPSSSLPLINTEPRLRTPSSMSFISRVSQRS